MCNFFIVQMLQIKREGNAFFMIKGFTSELKIIDKQKNWIFSEKENENLYAIDKCHG